ncbi:hypothetical protein FQN52_007599 [Onygenales sp. PD_12]|nr:hypothetical protein FQN52_007599 [Onygenales sp. PD_12]
MSHDTDSQEAFLSSLPEKNVAPLWTVMSKMVPPHPNPQAAPTIWRYNEMRPYLIEAGNIVGAEEAERRVLMLVNPNMVAPYTTDTIYSGLQLILPGETAPAHRHTAFALRFIIEGEDGFTAVEGQKMKMERGDVILTPPWQWHDHGNEGTKPMIWLDGLDLPLFRNVPINFAENYAEKRYPSSPTPESPLCIPWATVQKSFDAQTGSQHAVYHYSRSDRDKHLSDTLSAQAERISAGHTTPTNQETCSFIYHVKEGEGSTSIKAPNGNETTINWAARDTFVVPAWSEVKHSVSGAGDAYLFAVNDRPMVESLGLFRRASG